MFCSRPGASSQFAWARVYQRTPQPPGRRSRIVSGSEATDHQLQALGVRHVTLDWYTDDLELTRRHEWGWLMFATMAEKVFDLARETVRA